MDKLTYLEKLCKFIFIALIVGILYYLLPFFLPFLLGIVIAVLFEPIIVWLGDKTKIGRKISSVLIITTFFSIIFGSLYLGLSKITKEVYNLALKIPDYINKLIYDNKHIAELYSELPNNTKIYIQDTVSGFVSKIGDFVSTIIPTLFTFTSAFPSYFIASIIFIIGTYIISLQLPNLKPAFLKYFEPGKPSKKVVIALEKMKSAIVGFLRAQIILSILTFIIVYIGFWIIGFEYKATLSFMVILVDLLPILGTGAVLIPWSIYLLITGNISQGVGIIILYVFITMFRKAAESKLISDSIGISPLMTLISLYLGFELMGILGMIIGPTIVIVVKALEDARMLRIKIKI